MPTVPTAGTKVLVSGANGFIALWVIRLLLEKGHSVRGTVRSSSKGDEVKKLFATYGDRLETVIVEDFTKEGAFDEAVKGVDAIEHVASPVTMSAEDPQALIGPAVSGTVGILESARKYGKNVKRIVVTSSTAAILHKDVPAVYTEEDWNEPSVKEVETKGYKAENYHKYQASKVLAEKAAWSFIAQHKSSIGWDLVVLNPSMPIIHDVSTPDHLGWSPAEFYEAIIKGEKTNEELATEGTSFIDVRDLAAAHVIALEKEEAGGERIIVSSGPYKWQDCLDAINSITPPIKGLPKGNPGAGKGASCMNAYNNAKMQRILGLNARSIEETSKDIVLDFLRRGWVEQ